MTKKNKFSTLAYKEKALLVQNWLDEKKAEKITSYDISHLYSLCDVIIIASATSYRHAQSLADYILEQAKANKFEFLHIEGYQAGQWVLVDLNDIVVHILVEELRETYRLEDLWEKKSTPLDTSPVATQE